MDLSAVFETWHLGDGNYPTLQKGMCVNLSFEMDADEITLTPNVSPSFFRHLGEANYEFSGSVLREYGDLEDPDRLIILECSGFKFYVTGSASKICPSGKCVHGRGTLLLDHYLWVEFLDQYADPPDLFYTLRVQRIWMNRIPDHYISRTENAMAHPTRLQYAETQPIEVEEITSDSSVRYYVVEFSDEALDRNVSVPRTFNG